MREKIQSMAIWKSMFGRFFLILLAFSLLLSLLFNRVMHVSYEEQYQRLLLQRGSEALHSVDDRINLMIAELDSSLGSLAASPNMGSLLVSGREDAVNLQLDAVSALNQVVQREERITQLYLILPYAGQMISSEEIGVSIEDSTFASFMLNTAERMEVAGSDVYLRFSYPNEKPLGIFIARLNIAEIWREINPPSNLYLYTSSGAPLFSGYEEHLSTERLHVTDGVWDEELEVWNFSGSNEKIMALQNSITDWYLVANDTLSSSSALQNHILRSYFLTCMLPTLLLTIAATYLLWCIYRPLQEALKRLAKENGTDLSQGNQTEADLLHEMREKNQEEREHMNQMIDSVSDTLQERALTGLTEKNTLPQAISTLKRMNSPLIQAKNFLVVSIRCWYHTDTAPSLSQPKDLPIQVMNFCTEYFQGKSMFCRIPTTRYEDVLLFYWYEQVNIGECERQFLRWETKLAERFNENLYTVAVGQSDMVETLNDIPFQLSQARSNLNHSLLRQTLQTAEQTRTSLLQSACRELNDILEAQMQKRGEPQDWVRVEELIRGVYDTVLDENDTTIGDALLQVLHESMKRFHLTEEKSVIPELKNSFELEYVDEQEYVIACYSQAMMLILQQGKTSQYSYVSKAKRIIEQEYMDGTLSLESVSSTLGVTSQYLSRLFVEYQPPGFLDYLNQVRVDESKKLLVETNERVGDIAVQVGFGSPQSFIRVFKKYEEETPGQYRNRYRKHDE